MSDRLDLILLQGAVVGIAGKNGARKTILVYNLYGLIQSVQDCRSIEGNPIWLIREMSPMIWSYRMKTTNFLQKVC